MMEDLTRVDLAVLYDLLASQTTSYTQMLSQGISEQDFDQCRQNILRIQAEIDRRSNTPRFLVTESDIDFINQHYH